MDMPPDHAKNIFFTLMAGVGGALGYLYKEIRAGRKIKLLRGILASCVAGFLGFHMILVYKAMGFDEHIVGALNGITAFLGVDFVIWMVTRWIAKTTGISVDDNLKQALIDSGWTPPVHGPVEPVQQSKEGELGVTKISGDVSSGS